MPIGFLYLQVRLAPKTVIEAVSRAARPPVTWTPAHLAWPEPEGALCPYCGRWANVHRSDGVATFDWHRLPDGQVGLLLGQTFTQWCCGSGRLVSACRPEVVARESGGANLLAVAPEGRAASHAPAA